jgi:hypothetical protein
MDGYDNTPGVSDPSYNPNDPKWEEIRKNLGFARTFAMRIDLAHATPHAELASTGFCLATPGVEYLVFLPTGGSVTLNLSGVTGLRAVEWFNPADGKTSEGGTTNGGQSVSLTAPFSGAAVLYVHP